MDVFPWRTIAELRATNADLGEQNTWLLEYALDGDALLEDARAQRDRLNALCDEQTRALAESVRALARVGFERDEWRDKYEAAQAERERTEGYIADLAAQRDALRDKLVAAQTELAALRAGEQAEEVKPKRGTLSRKAKGVS